MTFAFDFRFRSFRFSCKVFPPLLKFAKYIDDVKSCQTVIIIDFSRDRVNRLLRLLFFLCLDFFG